MGVDFLAKNCIILTSTNQAEIQMGIHVEFDKYYIKGENEGKTITQKTIFPNWDDACNCAGFNTMDMNCSFVVLEARNLNTGEMENF